MVVAGGDGGDVEAFEGLDEMRLVVCAGGPGFPQKPGDAELAAGGVCGRGGGEGEEAAGGGQEEPVFEAGDDRCDGFAEGSDDGVQSTDI